MDRTGSPASFLTCSSGWDPGILCGAVKFPSLLHSRQSIDNFHPTQEIHSVPNEFKGKHSLLETELLRTPQSPSKVSFSVATPFYLSPSPMNGEFARLQPSDFPTPTLPSTALIPRLPSPTNSEYSAPSPLTTSPGSVFSLESTASSIYHDPFYWDTVLAGLPPSPQRSPVLPAPVNEHLSVTTSAPTIPVPHFVQCHEMATHSPQRDSICFTTTPDIIPTIVVRGPDSDTASTQASVSSIIGLYSGQHESTHIVTCEIPTLESQAPRAAPELDTDGEDTDGEGSNPESEFEIVTVPALKVRLDDILETDRTDAENAFGSLMVRCLSNYHSSS